MLRFSLRTLLAVLAVAPIVLALLWTNRQAALAFLVTFSGPFLIGCAYAGGMAAMIGAAAAIRECNWPRK